VPDVITCDTPCAALGRTLCAQNNQNSWKINVTSRFHFEHAWVILATEPHIKKNLSRTSLSSAEWRSQLAASLSRAKLEAKLAYIPGLAL
jgi:hypothetical protein